ncbi:MAG: HAD hydrolase family protein [Phycisphaerales bacterium]|nr:HAD hydrolase family protein [Phycisphaerales bacterium]MCI0629578.1 HAD hydrolase family protein [Phycisphaerales bacterium]MCI0674578.1 HAD hydrolase family protein [Phycisphaerales bacterium]
MPDLVSNIQLLCLDVDGVMTDGSINIDDHGVETKRFHVRDGLGIQIWMSLGFDLCVITARPARALRVRANELGISHVVDNSTDKWSDLARLLKTLGLRPEQTAMLADDLPDLPILRRIGYPMGVADAAPEVRQLAKFITTLPGGHGAVREAIEHLLRKKNRWPDALALFQQHAEHAAAVSRA